MSREDFSVYYEVTCPSDGPTLILVSGLGEQVGSIEFPRAQCEIFAAKGFQVVRLDNRGSGLTIFEEGRDERLREFTLKDIADDIAAVADVLGLEKVHLMGASLGGLIARWFAVRHPDRAATLTIVMSGSGAGTEDDGPQLTEEAVQGLIGKSERKERQAAIVKLTDYWRGLWGNSYPFDEEWVRSVVTSSFDRAYRPEDILRQLAAAASTEGLWEAQRKIACPTLVYHGGEDPCFPAAHAKATARRIEGAELWIDPNMGHIMHREQWDALAARVAGLAGLD